MSVSSCILCWLNLVVFRIVRNLFHHPTHQDARSLFLADLCDPDNPPRFLVVQKYRKTAKSKAPDTYVLPGTWRFAEMVWRSYGIELPGALLIIAAFSHFILIFLRASFEFVLMLLLLFS